MPLRIQALEDFLSVLFRQLLLSPLLQCDGPLLHPLQGFLTVLDYPTNTHPVVRGATRLDMCAAVDRLAPELPYFPLGVKDLLALEVAFEHISTVNGVLIAGTYIG